jgi:hypothetical protein
MKLEHGLTLTFGHDEKVAFITTLQMIDEIRGANSEAHWAGTVPARRVRYFAARTTDQSFTISTGGFENPDAPTLRIIREAHERTQELMSKPDELHAFATAFRRSTPPFVDQHRAAQAQVIGD